MRGQAVNYKRSWKNQHSVLGAGWRKPIWKNSTEILCSEAGLVSKVDHWQLQSWTRCGLPGQSRVQKVALWCNCGCFYHRVPHCVKQSRRRAEILHLQPSSRVDPATGCFDVKLIISKQPQAFTPENKVSLGWFDNCVQVLMCTSCVVLEWNAPPLPPPYYRHIYTEPTTKPQDFVCKSPLKIKGKWRGIIGSHRGRPPASSDRTGKTLLAQFS